MRVYRRPGSPHWHASLTVHGDRVRRSTGAEERATAELIAAQWLREALLGPAAAKPATCTLDEALGRHWLEHAHRLRGAETVLHQARHLRRILGAATALDRIDDSAVALYVARRRGERISRGSGRAGQSARGDRLVSDSTVNRELGLLRAVLRVAREKWRLATAPVAWASHRLLEPEPAGRTLTPDEARRLIAAAAPHVAAPIRVALLTGLRLRNVLDLDWSEIDLASRLIVVMGKSRRPGGKRLAVPIAPPLLALLANLGPRDAGPVFTWRGRRVGHMRRSFAAALRAAGIGRFRWHDLRHTAASWMVEEGAPLDVVQRILGHADIRTTQRYAHRRQDAQRDALAALGERLERGTDAAQAAPAKRARG